MGGEWSSHEREKSPDLWWRSTQSGTSNNVSPGTENTRETEESDCRKVKQEEMDSFKRDLIRKRELRHAAIASIQKKMEKLKIDLETERALRKAIEDERDHLANIKCDSMLTDEVERLKSKLEEERSRKKEVEEENNKLKEKECELEAVENQVRALKEVTSIGREMLRIRELQVNELKRKLQEIELSMPTAPEELRLEYESQIQNIRKLRTLYEERALATRTEHQQERERDAAKINMLELKVRELQEDLQEYKDKNTHLELKITKVEETVEEKISEIDSLQDQLHSSRMECHSLKSQMKIINNLFSQVLSGPKFDLDKLTRLLKENHGLITDLTATGDSNEVAALLLDIAEKAEDAHIIPGGDNKTDEPEESFKEEKEEIASNLSKVWRVLVELLSHHKDVNPNNVGGSESCYKSVDTPSGPRVVISVSQTFLTLKDLILEKNSLVKEVGRLKTLNTHLETRMYGQERRLSTVTTELKKTWSVVSKLRAQHKQLHNHEKILRYELQHKRQMLTELKQELEHCREKWDQARQKNTQSEEDWKQLRKEFALRKMRKLSNSAESGYEEEDSHSSPSEEINESPSDSIDQTINVIPPKSNDGNLSEEDVEHSDGNSYENVIDLLDIACLESQIKNENLSNTEELISFLESQDTLPLTDSELTEGLGHIESLELASELDFCQTNIQTSDLTTPFLSSSSSPIPTQNENLTSSEMDLTSEEIPRSVSPYHQFHFTDEPIIVQDIPQETLLFGSNSAQNISRFLEGLLVESGQNITQSDNKEKKFVSKQSVQPHLPEGIYSEPSFQYDLKKFQNQYFKADSQKESTSSVEDEKEIMSSMHCFTNEEQQIKFHDSLSTMNEGSSSTENETLTTYPEVMIEAQETTLEKGVGLPKILVVNKNVSTIQNNEETPEMEEKLVNESSVFDSESVANAIQLCLQDIKNSIPDVIQIEEENETIEVNNNISEINVCVSSVSSTMNSIQLEVNHCLPYEAKSITEEMLVEDVNRQLSDENNKNGNQTSHNKNEISLNTMTELTEPSTSNFHKSAESSKSDEIKTTKTSKEILEARAARLKRLEEQCTSLFNKMSATSRRSDLISNKLEELHEHYGPSQNSKNSDGEFLASTKSTPVLHPSKNMQQKKPTIERETSNPDSKVMKKRLPDSSLGATDVTTYTHDIDSDHCSSRRLEPSILSTENVVNINTKSENKDILDKTQKNHCKPLHVQVIQPSEESNPVHVSDEQLNQQSSQVLPENEIDFSDKQEK